MEPFETYEHAGCTVELHYDEYGDGCDPRENDNLAHLAVGYRGYTLGDEDIGDHFDPINCPVCKGGDLPIHGPTNERESLGGRVEDEPVCFRCEGWGEVEPTVEEWLTDREAVVAAPLFVYEHSGITISTGTWRIIEAERVRREDTVSRGRFMGDDAGWDTSFVGFVYVTEERAVELGIPGTSGNRVTQREALIDAMIKQGEAEVEEYASYMEGEVYFWSVKDSEGKIIESVGGYIGHDSLDYMRSEANATAEWQQQEEETEAERVREWNARDVLTV